VILLQDVPPAPWPNGTRENTHGCKKTMAKNGKKSNSAVDVGARQVAEIYAKALLGAAEAAGNADAMVAELDTLVLEVVDQYPDFADVLFSAIIKPEEKLGIVDRVLTGRVSAQLLQFVKVLVKHGRLDVIRQIRDAAIEQLDIMRRRARVEVTTAAPMTDAIVERINQAVRARLQQEPQLVQVVDPELIGGIVIRVGDTVYDGSVASSLERARVEMINRSVHEIQSRRDRFRHSEGN
jgi:F-type H+-transporting ATPase subunit delta